MTTHIQPIHASRRPLAALGNARANVIDSMKNRQNALKPSSLKRSIDIAIFSDTENVDPATTESPTKRSKGQFGCDRSISRSKFSFSSPVTSNASQAFPSTPALPRAIANSASRSAPLRAAAGRSPESKVGKAFTRRSLGYRRVHPPSSKHHSSRAPFSISDALSGTFTVSSFTKPQAVSNNSKNRRGGWDFEIHVDSEQEELTNLMEHSTCVLDISDDEEKSRKLGRGKENIPPADFIPQARTTLEQTASTSDTGEMLDRRSPLGELDPKEFVSKSEDSSDLLVLIPDDEDADIHYSDVPEKASLRKISAVSGRPVLLKRAVMSSMIKSATIPTLTKSVKALHSAKTEKESTGEEPVRST